MKLFLLTQDICRGYDTYDSCIVCAESEEEAAKISPMGFDRYGGWCNSPDEVNVTYIGMADEALTKGVILASFNAG
jgi:hypothetical protein